MRKSNDQTLKEVLKEFTEQKRFKDKLTSKKLENVWYELFSSLAGNHTQKISLQDKVMTVYLSSSSLRKELSLNKTLILQQLNKHLINHEIDDIVFR
ncbi:MAG: DUF721 domain-containing protein [Saprospiraceae bacterium]|nr:DUF721 domain-containing protein [Saprospiraceae bacterium]